MKFILNLFILIKLTYSVVVPVLSGFAKDIDDFLNYSFEANTKFEVICDLGIFDKTEEGRFITSSVFDDKFSAVDYYKTIYPNIITVTPVRDYNLGVGVENFHSAPFLSGESSYHTFCVIRSNDNNAKFVPNKNFIMNESLKYHYLPSMNGNFVLPGFYYAFKLKIQVINVVHDDMSITNHNTHHYLLFYDQGGSFNSDINSGLAQYQDDSPVNVVTFCKWGPKYRLKSMRYHINSESVYCPSPVLTYDFKVASISNFALSLNSLTAPELQIIDDFLNYESLENLNGEFADCDGVATNVFYIPAETNACYVEVVTNIIKGKCKLDLQIDSAVAIDDSYHIGDICWSSNYNTYFLKIEVSSP